MTQPNRSAIGWGERQGQVVWRTRPLSPLDPTTYKERPAMGNRLTRIATRTGDNGTTGLKQTGAKSCISALLR
ncbi:MAG: hypothetical protein KJ614_15900 [Gammaproteobacteria bacterium]|uniref:hypothetical protein n=1 Tax=Rhodoferax sp. TaxID=50421 RepID=UPI00183CF32E|nr:hypothetical protein [Rhodoferax sp.]MBU3900378.1 hypothetical protein [Gammaproteobacteria bacterium]MBA3058435.1 hypothetical protein [Rhodoferax sp.]MBU3999317.1 hypothetical protein [Gammaproteobacteria bacterium]MBU4018964.1 hypothetical protein [Gammaproteobacteria bacterium]MBU4080955.1 hypothetical protein [Gammaproteobacteria bacterium]